jgi:uncharacterized protein YozE (UPF0346 family)
MKFQKFCLQFKQQYPDDHRCDFINEAIDDISFPWEDASWSCIDYLESVGADSNCIKCYEELYEVYKDCKDDRW